MQRPIVASALDQIAEILRDGETAVMVKPGDPADLARGLLRIVDDPDLGVRIAAGARADAVAKSYLAWSHRTNRRRSSRFMSVSLSGYVRRAMTMPPHVAIAKAVGVLRRRVDLSVRSEKICVRRVLGGFPTVDVPSVHTSPSSRQKFSAAGMKRLLRLRTSI